MIGKNRTYKGYNFGNSASAGFYASNGYTIKVDVEHGIDLNTETFNNANYHGGYSSGTLVQGGRLFRFSGEISATTKQKRGEAYAVLMNLIKPEPNPNAIGRGLYDLYRDTDDGESRNVKAKVRSVPKSTNGIDDPIIVFSFELYTENERIYGSEWKVMEGGLGALGGFTLPATLPVTTAGYIGAIVCENDGDRSAPIKVDVIGDVTNLKLINATNGQKYRIEGETSLFTFDNLNLDNDPKKKLVVTDLGNDIKSMRKSGADVMLSPGENQIIVTSDVANEDVVVRVRFRDTYIH